MKMFVYNFREFDEGVYFEQITKSCGVTAEYTAQTPAIDNAHWVKGYECVNVITTKIDRPLLEKFKEYGVKYVTTRTIGYDHIDVAAAKELGIRVSNITYTPDTVAEYTVMLMLMAKRKMKRIMERAVIQDYTLKGIIGREINQCVVGIIGTGRIGETVIRDISGFGCKILAYDLQQKDSVKAYAQYTDLDTLLEEADIISLHMPANESNYHMLNKKAIDKMKQGVLIINTARGSLIDSEALISGIESGKVGGAALDVVEKELGLYYNDLRATVLDNRELAILKSFPNVIVTPHMAFYTEEAIHDMVKNSIESYCMFAKGEENPFEV